jgi:hypothetical protein
MSTEVQVPQNPMKLFASELIIGMAAKEGTEILPAWRYLKGRELNDSIFLSTQAIASFSHHASGNDGRTGCIGTGRYDDQYSIRDPITQATCPFCVTAMAID